MNQKLIVLKDFDLAKFDFLIIFYTFDGQIDCLDSSDECSFENINAPGPKGSLFFILDCIWTHKTGELDVLFRNSPEIVGTEFSWIRFHWVKYSRLFYSLLVSLSE